MKKTIQFIAIFFCCLQIINAQSGSPDASFGVNGSVTTNFISLPGLTKFHSIAIQSDGKLVAAGFTQNGTTFNLALARYNIDGSLDNSFSADGKVTTDSLTAVSLAIQKDGKILVAGSALARYNEDGSVDNTFSNDGIIPADSFYFSSMALQENGKILVTGTVGNADEKSQNFAVARYNPDGSLDNSFSADGILITDVFFNDVAKSIAVAGDGKILVSGYSQYNVEKGETESYVTLVRYNQDGTPDNNFNGNGIVRNAVEQLNQDVNSITLQNDGKILLAGSMQNNITITRFNTDGTVDNNFGISGTLSTNLFAIIAPAVIVQDDNKIVVGSSIFTSGSYNLGIARFNSNGSIDSSFSEDGMKETKISQGYDVISGLAIGNNRIYAVGTGFFYLRGIGVIASYTQSGKLDSSFAINGIEKTFFGSNGGSTAYSSTAIQADGKVVAVGSASNGITNDFAVARYNTDGSLDNTFSDDGKQVTDFGADISAEAKSVVIQKDGKIVVAGSAASNFAIARYNTDGSHDSTFNYDGLQTTIFKTNFFGVEVSRANSVAIQSDGKIVATGITGNQFYNHIALVRYNTDGSLDNTFDGDGQQSTEVLGIYSSGSSVVIQPDGKIVVAGSSGEIPETHSIVLRYNNHGSLDSSFNEDGIQSINFGRTDVSTSVALQPDGNIVIAGSAKVYLSEEEGFHDFFTLARLTTEGNLDSTFASGGKQYTNIGSQYTSEVAASLVIDKDGKILTGGYVIGDNKYYAAFANYNIDGSLNSNFSDDGIIVSDSSAAPADGFTSGGLAISGNTFYAVGTTESKYGIVSRYFLSADTSKTSPTVSITNPSKDTTYTASSNITLTATASDTDGTISKVEFYNGTTLLHTENSSTYSWIWKDVPVGDYIITAKAYDNDSNVTTSAPVHILVVPGKAPTVTITSPVDNATYITGKSIALSADASNIDGTIKMVQFYSGSTLIGTENNAPYYRRWYNVPAGDYTITAVATDNLGIKTTSAPVHIHVVPNQPPVVNITNPVNGASYAAPATFLITANASDADGTIETVEFYNGSTLLRTERYLNYAWLWKDVAPGTYTITAKATDNFGAVTTSAPVIITVTSPNNLMVNSGSSLSDKNDLNTSVSLALSPNPARDILNVSAKGLQNNKPTTISILSSSGVVIKTVRPSGSNQIISLEISGLTKGIYFVKIQNGDKVLYKQLTKL